MRGGSLSGGEENNVTLETDIYERQACDSISDSDFPVGTNESFLFLWLGRMVFQYLCLSPFSFDLCCLWPKEAC